MPFTHWATRPLPPGDVFWQVRTGLIALESGVMPASDSFSYTVTGMPWNNHEWLFELAAALVQKSVGWGGIRLSVLALVLATAGGLAFSVARRAGLGAALFVLTLFALFCRYKMMPVPQLCSLCLFLAAFALFRGTALASSRARLLWLAATMLLWGNVTAECFMFLPFVLLDQLALRMASLRGETLESTQRERQLLPLKQHVLLLLLACVAPTVNPPWSSSLEYALAGTAVNRAVNSEFDSIFAPATTVTPFAKGVAGLFILAYLGWAAIALYRSRSRWTTLRAVGPGILAVFLAASFERNLWLLLLPAARVCAALYDATREHARARNMLEASELGLSVALLLGLSLQLHWSPARALATLSTAAYYEKHILESALQPACLAPLRALERPANVYALRLWSNYLIFATPKLKVFVDGRNREYPEKVHEAAQRILMGAPDALALLMASKTEYVLVPPGWERTYPVQSGAYRPLASAPGCTLYVRR